MTLCEGYFSINDILTTQERVKCKFQLPVYNLGYLDPSSDGNDIQPGTKLELPLWLVQGLSNNNRRIVNVDIPANYKEGYREILQADATVVDLHRIGPDFYHFGSYLVSFGHAESEEVAKCLIQTFKDRFRRIMDLSRNSELVNAADLVSKLDTFEKTLFNIEQQSFRESQHWQKRDVEKITTSVALINHRKRKRTED